MDGVSGVSAVVTVAQLGFSLATTLNTYIADVRNGRGDIADLANEIEATVIHVEELDKLIQENSITGGWNENGLKIAKKCCTDCQAALNQLRLVFSKTGAAAIGDTDTRDSIDISLLNRLTWPSQKARLCVLKQDLQRVKIDILIALNTYKAHVGTPQSAKDAAAERVAALWRSRIAAQRQLVPARAMDPARGRIKAEVGARGRDFKAAQVFLLGKALWCIFEGVGQPYNNLGRSILYEPDFEFPEFRRTPKALRSLIKKCTTGAREWSSTAGPLQIYRRESRILPRGKTGLQGGEPVATFEETMQVLRRTWRAEVERIVGFVEAKQRYDNGIPRPEDFGEYLGYLERPKLKEVMEELERFQI